MMDFKKLIEFLMKTASTNRLIENHKTEINLQTKLCWPHGGKGRCICMKTISYLLWILDRL